MTAGEMLKTERERRGWTQEDLMHKLHCGQGTVSGYENSVRLGYHVLRKLDKIFGGMLWRSGVTSSSPPASVQSETNIIRSEMIALRKECKDDIALLRSEVRDIGLFLEDAKVRGVVEGKKKGKR